MSDSAKIQVGDIVIVDYTHAQIPLRGQVKAIRPDEYADIYIGKHGYNKITAAIDHLYTDRATYNAAMQAKANAEFTKAYDATSTVNGLLMFLSGKEMLCKGDANDAQWKAIMQRLDEARLESLKGCASK